MSLGNADILVHRAGRPLQGSGTIRTGQQAEALGSHMPVGRDSKKSPEPDTGSEQSHGEQW